VQDIGSSGAALPSSPPGRLSSLPDVCTADPESEEMEPAASAPTARACVARFRVAGEASGGPSLGGGVSLCEILRRAALSHARQRLGRLPAVLSGKSEAGTPSRAQHRHAHFLFEDADEDGRIDHLCVWCPDGLAEAEADVLRGIERIWTRDGREQWSLQLDHLGDPGPLRARSTLFAVAPEWESLSPFVLVRHPKRTRAGEPRRRPDGAWIDGLEEQLQRELAVRGLPGTTAIERAMELRADLQPRDFALRAHRPAPAAAAFFVRVRFAEPLAGPLALGRDSHFGLGAFRARPYRSTGEETPCRP
jgi:CRISPR-associated protein Csb2